MPPSVALSGRVSTLRSTLKGRCQATRASGAGVALRASSRLREVVRVSAGGAGESPGWRRWAQFEARLDALFSIARLEETPFAREAGQIVRCICAPYLFGSNEWPLWAEYLQKRYRWEVLTLLGALVAPRRFGKTLQACGPVCALMLSVPGTRVGWFANVWRACAQPRMLIEILLRNVYHASIKVSSEIITVYFSDTNETSSVTFFPGTVDSYVFPVLRASRSVLPAAFGVAVFFSLYLLVSSRRYVCVCVCVFLLQQSLYTRSNKQTTVGTGLASSSFRSGGRRAKVLSPGCVFFPSCQTTPKSSWRS